MVLVENLKNFPVLILVKISQQKVFGEFLERKKVFLDYETKQQV